MDYWWEKLQYQCPSCKRYQAFFIFRETKNWYQKKCKFCGFLGYKKERVFAIYKYKSGRTFLKRNGWKRFQEVELKQTQDYFQVVPKNIHQCKLKI